MGQATTNPSDLEQECETWDWARTAGVSQQQLREALSANRFEEAVEAVA